MNSLVLTLFASLAAFVTAAPSGHGAGAIIAGPAGVVTPYGPIGPLGLGHGSGYGGAAVVGPVAGGVVAGPGLGYGGFGAGYGGFGGGYGGYGGFGAGHGLIGAGVGTVVTPGGGVVGVGHHGVAVKGPATVPAVIAGPSGKIVADGLYGVPAGHGYHGW